MEDDIVKKIETTLDIESIKFLNDKNLESYEKALIEFNELVRTGKTKKRGYNLMTIDSKKTLQTTFFSIF